MLKKRVFTLVVLIVGSLIIISLSRNIFYLLQSEKKIDQARQEVRVLQEEQASLLKTSERLESERFIEEQARNKLNMVKEGEVIVVLPSGAADKVNPNINNQNQSLPNWQAWLQVFGW